MGGIVKIPYWKKALSYFHHFLIEQSESPYNPQLNIILYKGELQLCTEDAIYSFGKKYYNFKDAFDLLKIRDRKNIKEVLLLGLGLSSIPMILEKSLGMDCNYTAVEIDEKVIELANKYVLPDLNSNFEFACTDAIAFVNQDHREYDLITMDVFQGAIVPDKFMTKAFFENLKDLLAEDGILIFNLLANTIETNDQQEDFFSKFVSVFPNATYRDIRYNRMFFNKLD